MRARLLVRALPPLLLAACLLAGGGWALLTAPVWGPMAWHTEYAVRVRVPGVGRCLWTRTPRGGIAWCGPMPTATAVGNP